MNDTNPYEVPTEASGQVNRQPPRDKPLTATLFGVIHLVMGGSGLLFTVLGLIMQAATSLGGIEQPGLPDILKSPTMQSMQWINGFLSVVFCILLIVAGIGLLTMKPWGRTLSNYWGVLSILSLIVSLAVQMAVLGSAAMEVLQDFDPENQEQVMIVAAAGGGLFGGCIASVYPILVLIFMNRSSFVAAINAKDPTTSSAD